MLELLKAIFGIKKEKNEKIKPEKKENLENYIDEIEELHVEPEPEYKIVIKVCKISNEQDALNAIILVEKGDLVIGKIPDIEREADDEFIDLLSKLKNEIAKMGGSAILLGNEHILLAPKDVCIEKIKESEDTYDTERDSIKEKVVIRE
ncbi:hypothetical protein ACPB8Q_00785 [Methanocaldococcus indicus]|uniref:cell division protein SepF n=1 Tax=Methanocaldococcus indicus TaxID=213231 RepID=UPI003C6D1A58